MWTEESSWAPRWRIRRLGSVAVAGISFSASPSGRSPGPRRPSHRQERQPLGGGERARRARRGAVPSCSARVARAVVAGALRVEQEPRGAAGQRTGPARRWPRRAPCTRAWSPCPWPARTHTGMCPRLRAGAAGARGQEALLRELQHGRRARLALELGGDAGHARLVDEARGRRGPRRAPAPRPRWPGSHPRWPRSRRACARGRAACRARARAPSQPSSMVSSEEPLA